MPYYHTTLTISAARSMYAAHSMQIFCMHEIPGWPICQNLLNITQVYWNQYRSCVPNGILSYNSYYTAVCSVNSMWIFCMHGMAGLHATFAGIWCMHLKTLRGILFPRTQRAPCDVSSSNAWVNWRQGIVIINVTILYVRILYIHVNYKLSPCI